MDMLRRLISCRIIIIIIIADLQPETFRRHLWCAHLQATFVTGLGAYRVQDVKRFVKYTAPRGPFTGVADVPGRQAVHSAGTSQRSLSS